jgi:hypothetical protein
MNTSKLLGRSTTWTWGIEEITLGTNLSFSWTTLNASGGSGGTRRDKFAISWTIWTTGTNVAQTIILDWTYTISKCNAWYDIAGNWTLTLDVKKNGTTIFATTKPSITGTNQYSMNTWVLTTTTWASWDIFTLDITAVPWTTFWTTLYVELIFTS